MKITIFIISIFFSSILTSQNGHIQLEGALILSDENTSAPSEGMIRWNTSNKDFEGYNGSEWLSLTMTQPLDSKYNTTSIYNEDRLDKDNRVGTSVAISGDYAFIGAPKAETIYFQGLTGFTKIGVVYVYKFDGYNWNLHSRLAPTIDQSDGFGYAMTVDDNRLAISSLRTDTQDFPNSGTNPSPAIYIYELVQDQWIQEHEIMDPATTSANGFGYDLSLFENYLVVGAPYKNANGINDAGSAYVFQYDDTQEEWLQYGTILESSSPEVDAHFGWAVKINKDIIAIGVPSQDVNGNVNQGEVNIFKNQSFNFLPEQILAIPSGKSVDNFGYDIEMNDDILVASAVGRKVKGETLAGSIAYFRSNPSGLWDFEFEIVKPSPKALDLFGSSISLLNNELLVGAIGSEPQNSNDNNGSGLLYEFRQGQWNYKKEYFDYALLKDSHTSASVALGQFHLILGAPRAFATSDFVRPGKAVIIKK